MTAWVLLNWVVISILESMGNDLERHYGLSHILVQLGWDGLTKFLWGINFIIIWCVCSNMDVIVYKILSELALTSILNITVALLYVNMMPRIGNWLWVRILIRAIINLFMIRLWDSMESISVFNVIKFIRSYPILL